MGYYVSNEYTDEEHRENPPEAPILDKLARVILADSPRVTRFPCDFDKPQPIPGPGAEAGEAVMPDLQLDDQATQGLAEQGQQAQQLKQESGDGGEDEAMEEQ